MTAIVPVAKGFTNIRGSLKIAAIDFGMHASLVERKNGKFVMLEATQMDANTKARVDEMTDNGKKIEAILNLHPFHTMSVEQVHKQYPDAKLYGSERHVSKFSHLPWEKARVDSAELHEQFKEDIVFTVPRGVDFISNNEAVHFSSVLAYHKDSQTLHVSDTFSFIPMPKIAEAMGIQEGVVSLHPSLPLALQPRAGAATEFRDWCQEVISSMQIKNLCTAHSGNLLEAENTGKPIKDRLQSALSASEPVLKAHEALHGK